MNIRIPPLVVVFLAALLMWLLNRLFPAVSFSFPGVRILAALVALAGVTACTLGVLSFRRAGTTVNPLDPARASELVVAGIYRHSRNPMYLGFASLLVAWGLYLGNGLSLALLPLFVIYMNCFQIAPEERALASRFGEDYVEYRRTVRRWI